MPFHRFCAFAHRFNRPIHIAQAVLVLAAFAAGCALVADSTLPPSRSKTLVLVYSIKSALFLLYQYLTTHIQRFRRFASPKVNFILDVLDCLLWFTAFVISCMGGKRCFGNSCATLGVAGTVSLLLSATYFVTAWGIDWPAWRASKEVVQVERSVV